ncbi:MAG: type I restriction enzyme HsdR N-terminal domain-containing protein [Desulfarculus sp.]|nr:type I restriction enzyme HsdR N-terminal domain-containing protein [Desulfarculus sp.]
MDELYDLITGQPLPEREDEPVRQAAEALLLKLGYAKEDVVVEATRCLDWEGGCLAVRADLLVLHQGRPALLMRCARGSLVSREREAVATARLMDQTYVPLALVYNGHEAELLDVRGGKVIEAGPEALPGPAELAGLVEERAAHAPTAKETAQAARVYSAYSFISCPSQCTV